MKPQSCRLLWTESTLFQHTYADLSKQSSGQTETIYSNCDNLVAIAQAAEKAGAEEASASTFSEKYVLTRIRIVLALHQKLSAPSVHLSTPASAQLVQNAVTEKR